MPEIWLRYGQTDIVLDIKYENLARHIALELKQMPEQMIADTLSKITLTENQLIVLTGVTRGTVSVLNSILEIAKNKGINNFTVDVIPRYADLLKKSSPNIPIFRADYKSLKDRIYRFPSALIISQSHSDPLFGFGGAPTAIVRNFMPEIMSECFRLRHGNMPVPGMEGNKAMARAVDAVEDIKAISVEVIANTYGISDIFTGCLKSAFEQSVKSLRNSSSVGVESTKSVIISGGEEVSQLYLSDSLNCLWNCVNFVKENGIVVLLSESSGGLGSIALKMFVEGRLPFNDIQENTQYIDGLEHLLFLKEVSKKCSIGLISSLPRYYTEKKLGLNSFNGLKEALELVLSRFGKGHKVLVISDADSLYPANIDHQIV